MARPKIAKINVGVYDTTIHLYLVETDADVTPQMKKILKKHKAEAEDWDMSLSDDLCNGYAFLSLVDPLQGYLVYSKESLTVNLLTHETDHMRKFILDFKDIEDHEASANLNAYINQEVFRAIKKWGFEIIY